MIRLFTVVLFSADSFGTQVDEKINKLRVGMLMVILAVSLIVQQFSFTPRRILFPPKALPHSRGE